MDDSSIASSTAGTGNHGTHGDDSRRWTYVPDATISASVVTGTKGFLDIKGIYYQSGNFASGGVVWFDDTGLQRSTNAPQTPVITSKQVLTAITKVTLSSLSAGITVAVGDIVKQDSTGAFGIVETAVTGGNSVNLIGVEGTFNTTNNLRREGRKWCDCKPCICTRCCHQCLYKQTTLDIDSGRRYLLICSKNSEVDINVLVNLYHTKLAAALNQNVLLEAKLQTLKNDFEKKK